MNKILEKIGQILGNKSQDEQKLEDVKDATGNIIRIEKYEVGSKAQLISTDGSLIELPDGEYTLEDGRSFTVAAGVISAISQDVKNPETPAEVIQPIANEGPEVAPEEAPKEETPKGDGKMEERVTALEEAIKQMAADLETLMGYMETMASSTKEFKEVKKNLEKEKEELNKKIQTLEMQPAGEPIAVTAAKIEAGATKEIDYAARYTAFRELQKNQKIKK